jgi:hypothetical protein
MNRPTKPGLHIDLPFTPTAEMAPDTKLETTWAVFQGYHKEIADRDQRIAELILERDALSAALSRARSLAGGQ